MLWREAPVFAKALFQIDSAKTPERCIPGRALSLPFIRAAWNIPAFYNLLEKAVREKALPMGTRQIPSPYGGRPVGILEVAQDLQGLCALCGRCGHETVLRLAYCAVITLAYNVVSLLAYYVEYKLAFSAAGHSRSY